MNKNSKGFTLIELLAVIVIMGILMMVAIPAMSKVIENSRKDTFIETAQTYTNAVNTLWKADSLYCGSEGKLPSTLGTGDYYVLIDSDNSKYNGLIERGGNSSWGNKPVRGYVKVSVSFDSNGNRIEKYNVALTDEIHGIKEISNGTVNDLKRNNVLLNVKESLKDFDKTKALTCAAEGKGTDKYVPTLGDQILEALKIDKASIQEAKPVTFANVATTAEGVFKANDEYGDSYYFRGAVTNNNVKLGTDYYKIIRINGNGTVRMIYAGQDANIKSDDQLPGGKVAYNSTYNDPKYVKFTDIDGKDSTIKVKLDSWYNTLEYKSKIAQESFCNDTKVIKGDGTSTDIEYGAYDRLYTNKTPTLICPNSKDNLKLTVGLITADEVSYAGGVYNKTNNNYYLDSDSWYWTMSPYKYFSSGGAYAWRVDSYGRPTNDNVYYTSGGVRPVINLKADLLISKGEGTTTSPFEVQ